MGVVPLGEKTRARDLASPLSALLSACEDVRRCSCETGKRCHLTPDCWHLDLGLPSLQNCKNSMLFI